MNWGIIGLGHMAKNFANAINEVDKTSLLGASSRSFFKLIKFGFKNWYRSCSCKLTSPGLQERNQIVMSMEDIFEKIKSGKVKIEIYKKYKLENIIQAHKDLESRKILGPAIIIP